MAKVHWILLKEAYRFRKGNPLSSHSFSPNPKLQTSSPGNSQYPCLVLSKFIPALIAAILLSVVMGCAPSDSVYFAEYENVRPINLTNGDLQHILDIAGAVLRNETYEKKTEAHRNIYHQSPRGVFLSALRPKERAITAFGWGDTIEHATKEAALLLKRIGKGEDLPSLRLRLDVIDKTSGRREKTMKKRWTHDLAHEGLMFDTEPVVALLPQEIIGYRIIESGGDYYAKGMKGAVKGRVLGRILRESFQDDSTRQYIRFSTQSCIQNKSGGIDLLYGANNYDMPVSAESVKDAALAAGEYLKRNVDLRSGKMNYRYYPHRDLDSVAYNELRHAGALYGMIQIYGITHDPEMLAAIEAGFGWLKENIAGPKEADKATGADFLTVKNTEKNEAKTGCAAMAIAAMTEYTKITGNSQYLSTMHGLARFIAFSVEENGKLQNKYFYDNKKHKSYDSNFYAGACVMALTVLYQLDKNAEWLSVAQKMADYLRTERDGNATVETVPHDYWISMAAEKLYSFNADENLLNHVFLIGDSMLAKQLTDGPQIDVIGGYAKRPSSTPTACRTEALIALTNLSTQVGQSDRADRYWNAAMRSAQLLLRMQYNETNAMFFPNPSKTIGGFMASYRRPQVQIDYVQHSALALIGVWKEFLKKSDKGE